MANDGNNKEHRQCVLSVLVENRFGVLSHVAGLFGGRGFNIDSLAVGETHDPTISRMTIVTRGDALIIGQIVKQLNRLVDVIKVENLSKEDYIERELLMVKLRCDKINRNDLFNITQAFSARVIDLTQDTIIIELTASSRKVESFIDLLKAFEIQEIARTGRVALIRGKK